MVSLWGELYSVCERFAGVNKAIKSLKRKFIPCNFNFVRPYVIVESHIVFRYIVLRPTLQLWEGVVWVERWCWVNFQCRGVVLIWLTVGQGPTALAVGLGEGCLDIFLSSVISFFFLSLSLWETARYRLKYCLKGTLSPKQPTNQQLWERW